MLPAINFYRGYIAFLSWRISRIIWRTNRPKPRPFPIVKSSHVYTPHKQRGITRIDLGRVWCGVSSRTCLAGLSVFLHKENFIFVLLPCVACCVHCVSRCWLSSGVSHDPEQENEVILPLVTHGPWAPCKERSVWAGAVIFSSAMCSMQFAKASVAILLQQKKNDSTDVQRGRLNTSNFVCTVVS
jgi:hypothetical protein